MSDDRTLDRLARAWLEEGPGRAPEHTVEAALDRIAMTRQERAWPIALGHRWTGRSQPVGWAAAMVAVVALGGLLVFGRGPGTGPGVSPTPSPSTTPSSSPSTNPQPSPTPGASAPDPSSSGAAGPPVLTATFISTRNGYSVQYPGDWTATPASANWVPGTVAQWGDPSLDELRGPTARFVGASQALVAGQTVDQWFAAYATASCLGAPGDWPSVPIGGATGLVAANGCTAPDPPSGKGGRLFEAVAVAGGRAYDFAMQGELTYADFLAFLSTITLDPGRAIDPTSPP